MSKYINRQTDQFSCDTVHHLIERAEHEDIDIDELVAVHIADCPNCHVIDNELSLRLDRLRNMPGIPLTEEFESELFDQLCPHSQSDTTSTSD